jgi:hypothetical protein
MLPPSTSVTRQAEAPPVGSVEVTTLPELSTATQSFAVGQETASRPFSPSASTSVQAEAPPVGSVEVMRLPTSSTATQSFLDGQETPRRGLGCPEAECFSTSAGVLEVSGRPEVTTGAGAAVSAPEIVTITVATLARRVIPMIGLRIGRPQSLLGCPAGSAASQSSDHCLLEFPCRRNRCRQSYPPIRTSPLWRVQERGALPRLERSPSMSRRSQTGFPSAGATLSGGPDV